MEEHKMNAECLIRFERIINSQDQIQKSLDKLTGAVFGNGKMGLKEDVAQSHRDIIELREALYEQDKILEEIRNNEKDVNLEKRKEESSKRSEILKFVLTTVGLLFAGALQFVTVYFLWKLTGNMP
jgi:hypothetical protein